MSTSELQGLQLPSFWNRNIDGIQALMDHTTFLAKIVQWLSFLFPGNSVCFLVCLSTTYLQTAMIWSHAVLLGLYHGLLGTFCSSLARPTTARKGGTTLGKRWAGTQMQGLRDWSHIPTVATKADSCVKQNQIKKKRAKRQHKTKQQRNRSQYPYMPFCALHPVSIFQNFQMSIAWVSPSFPLQSSPHLWRIFPPPSHVLWPLCSSRHIRKNLQVGSIVMNVIHFDIPKWCEHKHRYRLFFFKATLWNQNQRSEKVF